MIRLLREIAALRHENPRETSFQRLRKAEAVGWSRPYSIRWRWLADDELPPLAKRAVVAGIDRRFWRHRGVDWAWVLESYRRNRRAGFRKQGASTIPMQVVKNLYFDPTRSYRRKIAEALLAPWMERVLGKDRILEIYLNVAEWGDGIFGIEAAANHHYGKRAVDLTVSEVSRLVAVLPAPLVWSPVHPPLLARLQAERIRRRLERGEGAKPGPAADRRRPGRRRVGA